MRPLRTAVAVCAALGATVAVAQQVAAPADYVIARQQLMEGMSTLMIHLDHGVDLQAAGTLNDEQFHRLTEEAAAVASMLHTVPLLFPDGTRPDDLPEGPLSHVADAAFDDPAAFRAAAEATRDAAQALADAPDATALTAAFDATSAACTACHATYLAYDPFASVEGEDLTSDDSLFDFSDGASN